MNIFDYVKWRGDIGFKDSPFNEVDSLCFSQIMYLKFEEIVKDEDVLTLPELSRLYEENVNVKFVEKKTFAGDVRGLLRQMAGSKRFKDAKFHSFKSIFDSETSEQFAAASFDLPGFKTIIAFRGTDDTIAGWDEDFKTAYEITRAQLSASQYAKDNMKVFRKYYLVGHSKGGNLALYAGVNTPKKLQKKIINVYSNDGPGIADEFMDKEGFENIKNRYIKIVPEFDIFGTIFNTRENYIVVKSDAHNIMQHSGSTWQVDVDRFERINELCDESKIISEGVNSFMLSYPIGVRRDFFTKLFGILKDLGVTNMSDIGNIGLKELSKAFKEFSKTDDKFKEVGVTFIKVFTDALNVKEVINTLKKR